MGTNDSTGNKQKNHFDLVNIESNESKINEHSVLDIQYDLCKNESSPKFKFDSWPKAQNFN